MHATKRVDTVIPVGDGSKGDADENSGSSRLQRRASTGRNLIEF
jgi:hypothetical protein